MHRIDGPGATEENKFTEGDPAGGARATVVTGDWLNSIQEEIANAIEEDGQDLDKTDPNQLTKVFRRRVISLNGLSELMQTKGTVDRQQANVMLGDNSKWMKVYWDAESTEQADGIRIFSVVGTSTGRWVRSDLNAIPVVAPVISDAIWSWWAKPIVLQHDGKTYMSLTSQDGTNGVASIDQKTGELVVVPLSSDYDPDDHNAGSLVTDGESIAAFFSGRRNRTDEGVVYYYVSPDMNLENLGSEQSISSAAPETNYPNTYAVDGSIVLFYRGTGADGDWYSRVNSFPLGAWENERVFFNSSRTWAYFTSRRSRTAPKEINLALSWHPENETFADISVAKLVGDSDTPWDIVADGVVVGNLSDGTGLPVDETDLETVYSAAVGEKTRLFDVHDNAVVYAVYTGDGSDAIYRYAYKSGASWQHTDVIACGSPFIGGSFQYFGGMAINDADPSIIYLSRESEGEWYVEEYRTEDGGATFELFKVYDKGVGVRARPMAEMKSETSSAENVLDMLYWQGRYITTDNTNDFTTTIMSGRKLPESKASFKYMSVGETLTFYADGSTVDIPIKMPPTCQFRITAHAYNGPAAGENSVILNPNGVTVADEQRRESRTARGSTLTAAESSDADVFELTSQSGQFFTLDSTLFYVGPGELKLIHGEIGSLWGDGSLQSRTVVGMWNNTTDSWDTIGNLEWLGAGPSTRWQVSVTRLL